MLIIFWINHILVYGFHQFSKSNITKWTFGQGLFFVTSLLTTVGK